MPKTLSLKVTGITKINTMEIGDSNKIHVYACKW